MEKIIWQQREACPINTPYTIYKITNKDGTLYIGRTKRPLKTRLAEHARNKSAWFKMIYSVQITCVKTLKDAKTVEKDSIAEFCPRFNKLLVPDRCKIK